MQDHTNNAAGLRRFPIFGAFIEKAGHPLFLLAALALWWALDGKGVVAGAALLLSLVAMEILERLVPAEPQWRQSGAEKFRLLGIYLLVFVLFGAVIGSYEALLYPALEGFRLATGTALWPYGWPIVAQILVLYFASDLIYYWIHRGIHNSAFLWRLSGHGFHHAFHNLHAININAAHPFEVVFLALPMVLIAALFGAPPEAVAGASTLLAANATMAHANVSMETPVFNWFFTASNQHRRHHSQVFAESNTNYACNAILWDRLFGSYSEGAVRQTGIGPTQPGLWQMFLLPFREPRDADTVSSRGDARRTADAD